MAEVSRKIREKIAATNLIESNQQWKSFFETEYDSATAFVAAIPLGATQQNITLLNYYFSIRNIKTNEYAWHINIAAQALYDSSQQWKEFFDKEYSDFNSLIDNIPKEYDNQYAILVNYYCVLNSTLKINRRKWREKAIVLDLIRNHSSWHVFFSKHYKTAKELRAGIPKGATQSLPTLVGYYISHNDKLKNSRQLELESCAIQLEESTPEWKKFFKQKYKTPKELIDAIPSASTLSLMTIFNYYIAISGHNARERQWRSYANAVQLISRAKEWQIFFNMEYNTPQEMIDAIPKISKYHLITITAYYLEYTAKKNARTWHAYVSAYELAKSSEEYQKFFNNIYEQPKELIKAIPPSLLSHLNHTTIMSYYLVLKEGKVLSARRWISYANVIKLINTSAIWEEYFNTIYNDPTECIRAIPTISKIKYITIVEYYIAYHREIERGYKWVTYAVAKAFFEKQPLLFKKLLDNKITFDSAVKEYKLEQQAKTIRNYFNAMCEFGV